MFQDKLKKLRKKHKITQETLARELNLSRSVIAKWETGIVYPNDNQLEDIARYFNIKKEKLKRNNKNQVIISLLISFLSIILIVLITLAIIKFPKKVHNLLDKVGTIQETYVIDYRDNNDKVYLEKEESKFFVNELEELRYSVTIINNKLVESSYYIYIEGTESTLLLTSFYYEIQPEKKVYIHGFDFNTKLYDLMIKYFK